MKILNCIDFFSKVGVCSSKFIVDVINIYNIGFATIHVNIDREDIAEICLSELENNDYDWSSDDITVIYYIYDITLNDSMARCAILHAKESELIRLFKKTKKLKAFL